MLKKISKILIAFLAAIFVALICNVLAVRNTARAAGGVTVDMISTLTEIKSNEAGKEFTVTARVKNTSGTALFGGQVTLKFDVNVFEYVDVVKNASIESSDVDRSKNAQKLWANGVYTIMADDNGDPITATQWDMGGVKLKLKSGVSPTVGATSSIEFYDCMIADIDAEDVNPTLGTEKIDVSFTQASSLCDIQTISVNGNPLELSGSSYSYDADYNYKKLTGLQCTVSAGAKASFSPALNSNLTELHTPVTITVTAEDGTTTKTYTLYINRKEPEKVNTLSSLVLKNGGKQILTLTRDQLSGTNVNVTAPEIAYADRNNLSVEFTKSGDLATASGLVDGASKGGSSFSLGNLTSGAHVVQIVVRAQDESMSANTYTLNFTIAAADTTNKLSSLEIKLLNGTTVNFTPDFSPEVLNYSATVPAGTEKVNVIAAFDGGLATVTGDGEQSVPGSINVKITAEDGSSFTYTIAVAEKIDVSGLQLIGTVACGVENDGTKHVLDIVNTSLDNYFKITIPYSLSESVTHIKIEAKWDDKTYDVQGINTAIEITENPFVHRVLFVKGGVEEKRITFDIIRETNLITLESLAYDGTNVALSDDTDYSFKVGKDAKFITIEAVPKDKTAKVTYTSSAGEATEEGLPLEEGGDGWTLILVKVESTAGNTGFYTLRVKKDGLVGVPWWVWLIVVALALLAFILLIVIIVKSKKGPPPPRITHVRVTPVRPSGGGNPNAYNDAELRRSIAEQERRIQDLESRDDGGFNDPFDFVQHR